MKKVAGNIRFVSPGLIITLLFLLLPSNSRSQNIVNIRAERVKQYIVVRYGITSTSGLVIYDIELYVSMDRGRNFTGPLEKVTGDVGTNIKAGPNLSISWDVLGEFESLRSDQVVFEIRAYENKVLVMDCIPVEGGSFKMGSRLGDNNEKPVHQVTVNDYSICKYEVTQRQWTALMGNNPSRNNSCPDCPVENVTYYEALDFIEKLNQAGTAKYRLPTEAEWEYAAGGGPGGEYPRFSGGNDIYSLAWYEANSGGKTKPVGRKQPNPLGLYDMSGNVLEWCSDFYNPNYYRSSPARNPNGPPSGSSRVLRGGAFNQTSVLCTIYKRQYEMPDIRSSNIGFRLVKIMP